MCSSDLNATYAGVTAYGSTVPCRVKSWFTTTDTTVYTFCGGPIGSDERLTVYVARNAGPLGFGRAGATAWASQPATARYRPNGAYRWSSSGSSPVISRSGRGVYTVRFAGQAPGGAAFVSAYGTKARVCQVGSIAKRGSSASVGVRCFRLGGAPADAMFTIGWTR